MVSGEKRNCEEENALERVTTILLDIEGTTTSISFVKDTLFPYVRENLEAYVSSHWNDDEFKADAKALKLQAEKDAEEKIENLCSIEEGEKEKETLIKNVLWQMDLDRKTTALKQLQGHIWREGYENGKIKGHVYGDVAQIFKKWGEDGRKLYIYSSGSVEAQKLLFKNSESGDLSECLSGYFDTEVGPKTEASSYTNIAKAVGCDPGQILFLTDVVKEAVAADKAGLQVMIVIRDGNNPLSEDEKKAFMTVSSLRDIVFESSNKKKKICEEDGARNSSEKAENLEAMDESNEMKNGDAEKMETEFNKPITEDCNPETKTEENGQSKMEATTEALEAESENIDIDVDDSNAGTEGGEKVVSSSVAEESGDGTATAEETEKPSEEAAVTKPENVETTEEPTSESNDEAPEKNEAEVEQEEKSVNGHENGELKEITEKEVPPAEETKNGDANGKEEEIEAVAVKKVAADDQADSTVEVTA